MKRKAPSFKRPTKRIKRSYRKKGRKARKNRIRNKAKLKKVIKGVVNRMSECDTNNSIHRVHILGDLYNMVNNTNGRDTFVFAHQYEAVNVGQFTFDNCRFKPCAVDRLLHWSSILYNGKFNDYNVTTGVGNFDTKSLKLKILYASYHVALKNITPIDYTVTAYIFMNKRHSDVDVANTIKNVRDQDSWLAGALPTWNIGSTTVDSREDFEPGELKSISSLYHITKKTAVVRPGDTFNYFYKKENHCIDFAKLQKDTGGIAKYVKGDLQIMFRFSPHTTFKPLEVDPGPSPPFGTGQRITGANSSEAGWAVDVKEVVKVEQPDDTDDAYEGSYRGFLDFYSQAVINPAGGSQFVRTGPTTYASNVVV